MTREEIVWAAATVEVHDSARARSKLLPASGLALFVLAAQSMTVLMLAASTAPDYDVAGSAGLVTLGGALLGWRGRG